MEKIHMLLVVPTLLLAAAVATPSRSQSPNEQALWSFETEG